MSLLVESGPEHAGSGEQKQSAEQASQPDHGNACAQVRAEQAAGDGADQQGDDQTGIDVAEAEVLVTPVRITACTMSVPTFIFGGKL